MAKKKNKPQQQGKHPSGWQRDLNPEQNIGERPQIRPAAEIKEAQRWFGDFTNDELAQVAVVAPGQRLEQGAVYLDLRGTAAEPITATGNMSAAERHLYVAKSDTPYEIWNRLVEVVRNRVAEQGDSELSEETVDKTLADSFPTSDPPAWTTGREPSDPGKPQAPREKRAEPED